ncbi:hypothetical protein HOY80DRAFT_485453 [Tuber brumale]|nr:hypothetical protein HOY80DRAFT_485453 [Tuber brumale]
MPTPTHDSLQYFFTQTVFGTFVKKVEFLKAQELVTTGAGTSFTGFEGDWCRSTEKLPDAFVRVKGSEFSVVVCEAGWAEKLEDLTTDAKLWLLNTGGQTKIVIVTCFTETHTKSETGPTSETDPTGETDLEFPPPSGPPPRSFPGWGPVSSHPNLTGNGAGQASKNTPPGARVFPGPGGPVTNTRQTPTSETDPTSEVSEDATGTGGEQLGEQAGERALIKSINETTKLRDLANQLLDLNEHEELGTPLIGKLQASLYVYCANEDYKDITEVFSTPILPPLPANSGVPRLFQITIKDIFGEDVPKDMKPTDPITFSLPVLGKLIEESLPGTAWYRANRRAKKLLKAAGVWQQCDTFGQRKRRRKDGA